MRVSAPPPISIVPFELGPFATNSYVVWSPGRADCWIVDPSFGPAPLIAHVGRLGLRPNAVVLTHAHADHIAGVPDVRRAYPGVPVLLHEAEREWMGDPERNLSVFAGEMLSMAGPDGVLRDGETLALGPTRWLVRHTPGHSPGGVSLILLDDAGAPAGAALVGDTLFAGSVGRSDFPGSDPEELASSIRRVLYALPDATVIYPGHGPASTIGREKRTNPFVRA